MPDFEVTTTRQDDELVVRVSGDLDLDTVRTVNAVLDPLLVAPFPTLVVFDLGGVTFIDSSGLALLVGYCNDGRAAGFAVGLRHVGSRTQRLLQLTRLDDAFIRVAPPPP